MWHSMKDAPKDGTVIELRHVSSAYGELVFRAFWFAPFKIWIDWDRQHVELDKRPLAGWRECVGFVQPVPQTDEQRATMAERDRILLQVHG